MSDHENDLGDVRYAYPRDGVVTRRDDPLNLARVKVRVPGLIEPESAWALPVGTHGGSAQRGLKFVPHVGAEVVVIFIGGDPDNPRYFAGHWGIPTAGTEMLSDVKSETDHPEDVNGIESDRWAIMLDDRKGKERLVIRDKVTGDFFEMDGVAPGIQIKASAGCLITVDGIFSVKAAKIVLNDRTLSDGTQTL